MNAIIERPVASQSAGDPLADLASACARLGSDRFAPALSRALVCYWSVLGSSAAATRLRFLHGIRESVRQGRWPARVFAVAALGDADGEIVFSATLDYVARGPVPLERRDAAVLDVLEWIRQRLPLNVPATFAALLSLGDAEVDERLLPLRLGLPEEEFRCVAQVLAARGIRHAQGFLDDWEQLLGTPRRLIEARG
jgi:hypothetical protein